MTPERAAAEHRTARALHDAEIARLRRQHRRRRRLAPWPGTSARPELARTRP
jgi:hypothetical protein